MISLRTLASSAVLAATCLGLSVTAKAALITQWTFQGTNDWVNTSFSSPGSLPPKNNFSVSDTLPDGGDPNGPGNNYDIISWGSPATPQGRSFLALDDAHSSSQLFTNDLLGISGTHIYHGNYPQRTGGENWLDSTTAVANVSVTPVIPGAPTLGPVQRQFFIDFTETVDTPNTSECPGAPWQPGTTPCPDWFTVNLSNASFSIAIDDYLYTFSLVLSPLGSENIARFTLNDGTATVWTEENVRSVLATRIIVTAQRIPEPASLGLLGLGVAALGLAHRRRQRVV